MIDVAVTVGLATLAAGALGALLATRLRTLRGRLAAFGLLCAILPVAAVVVSGVAMFDSEHDLTIVGVAASASLAAVLGALLVARSTAASVDGLREAAARIRGGDLGARAPGGGPAELAELAASFNEMAANVESLFDARRQLMAWASHDLRTPLAAMQALLEGMEDGVVEADRALPVLREQVRSLGALVDDLFELARLDAGAAAVELADARLEAVVARCVDGLEPEAAIRGVTLETHVDEGLPGARCDAAKVERVVRNLLANALAHTPTAGRVTVTLTARGDRVRVSVEDSGAGIPAAALGRVFEPFWRGDPARTRNGGGAGLGLAIAQGLVEAQGGRIWAENADGAGARVSFELPAAG